MPLYLTKINLQKYIFEITYNCFLRSISLVLSISSAPKDILGEGGGVCAIRNVINHLNT